MSIYLGRERADRRCVDWLEVQATPGLASTSFVLVADGLAQMGPTSSTCLLRTRTADLWEADAGHLQTSGHHLEGYLRHTTADLAGGFLGYRRRARPEGLDPIRADT
jgi:hypothetical protein